MEKWPWVIAVAVFLGPVGCDEDVAMTPARDVFGSGNVVDESRSVTGFTGIRAEAIGKVYVTIGNEDRLVVSAEDNLLPHIVTEVQDGVLRIRVEDGIDLEPTEDIEYRVTARSLESLSLSGVGAIEGADISAGALSLSQSGVGGLRLGNLDLGTLDASLSGVGEIVLSGNVVEQTVTHAGVGRYDASNLASAEAVVTLSSVGSVSVRVSDRLTATSSGIGSICYIGSPTVEATITGSGTVGPCS